jgi:hypothetical protein
MSEDIKKEDVGFLITIQKQSMLSGEVITVSTNLPLGSLSEDIRKTIETITTAIDWRIPQNQTMADQMLLEKLAKQQPDLDS